VLLLLEFGLRLLGPRLPGVAPLLYLPSVQTDFDAIEDLPTLMRSTAQGYTPLKRRGDFIYNSRSMRTAEYAGTHRPGVFRIAVFADSFANSSGGTPYRQVWPTRLGSELATHSTRPVEVFSLGVGGVGPGFALRLWELERELLRADLVVVGFFVGNDFTDEAGASPWQASRLRRHSHLVRLLGNLQRLLDAREEVDWLEEAPVAEPPERGGTVANPDLVRDPNRRRFPEQTLVTIETPAVQLCLLSNRRWFEERLDHVVSVLDRFASEVRLDGADFVVALLPDQVQVRDAFRARILRQLGAAEGLLAPGCPQRPLAAALRERDIPVLDLLPAFRAKASEGANLYWPGNTHWNVEGNDLAARELALFLEERIPRAEESGAAPGTR
jgi:hypothetical protein